VFGITCIARIAHGDAPSIAGHIALGARASSTSDAGYGVVFDDTSSVRVATEGLIGLRFGRVVVGLHAGIATPLKFSSSPQYDSGEQVASTTSTIYPFDLGLGVQVDAGGGVWLAAWLGATVSVTRASSPAMHVSAIDFTGDIPAASWSDRTTNLGFGVAVGYDFLQNQYGRVAGLVTLESQAIGPIPIRSNSGSTGYESESQASRSITIGIAYRY
jgi:hypothetical protein